MGRNLDEQNQGASKKCAINTGVGVGHLCFMGKHRGVWPESHGFCLHWESLWPEAVLSSEPTLPGTQLAATNRTLDLRHALSTVEKLSGAYCCLLPPPLSVWILLCSRGSWVPPWNITPKARELLSDLRWSRSLCLHAGSQSTDLPGPNPTWPLHPPW